MPGATTHTRTQPEPVPQPRAPVLLFLLGVALLLPSIWSETSVTGSDEYTLSLRTPMEMLERGQWLTPWLDGEPRLRKPPLVYWAILANYKLFGVNLTSARIWGVLSGAGLALCAALLSRRLFRNSGWAAGLLTLATVGVAAQGRQALLDMPVALLSALAVLCWLHWLETNRWRPLLSSAVCLGLAFLAKGPAAFLFFFAGALPAWWILRPARTADDPGANPAPWIALLIWAAAVLALCLPWPLAMKAIWGERFSQILGEEAAARKAFALAGLAPLSALGGALGLVFPWSLLVVGAAIAHFRAPRPERSPAATWLIAWVLFSVLPFFFMKSFERYMLAVLPAQTALCAWWLGADRSGWGVRLFRVSLGLLAVVAAACCGFALWFRLSGAWPAAGLLVVAAAVWLGLRPGTPERAAGLAAVALAICFGAVYPGLGMGSLPAGLEQAVAGRKVVQFRSSQPSLLSMRLGYSVRKVTPDTLGLAPGGQPEEQTVFVEESQQALFDSTVATRNLRAQEAGKFKTFYSRKAWLRFARAGAGWPEWREALRERSLEGLKPEIRYYRVTGGDR